MFCVFSALLKFIPTSNKASKELYLKMIASWFLVGFKEPWHPGHMGLNSAIHTIAFLPIFVRWIKSSIRSCHFTVPFRKGIVQKLCMHYRVESSCIWVLMHCHIACDAMECDHVIFIWLSLTTIFHGTERADPTKMSPAASEYHALNVCCAYYSKSYPFFKQVKKR